MSVINTRFERPSLLVNMLSSNTTGVYDTSPTPRNGETVQLITSWANILLQPDDETGDDNDYDEWSSSNDIFNFKIDKSQRSTRLQLTHAILSGIPLSYPNIVHLVVGLDVSQPVPTMAKPTSTGYAYRER